MKVAVVGTRGIPGVHGGVERHCEELYPRIVALGNEVTVYAREGYVDGSSTHLGVTVEVVGSRQGKGLEAFTHTAAAMKQAARDGCDVLHVHSIGPSALLPLARTLGFRRIVTTVHAPDYRQKKWGWGARALLLTGEYLAVRGANETICVADWYADELHKKYARRPTVIPNGPGLVGLSPSDSADALARAGITAGEYLLFVGRLIPDKRVEDLLAAAARACPNRPIVIAGGSSDTESYASMLQQNAPSNVHFLDFVYGQDLVDLFAHARVVVLPSAVEGLPITVMEAMALGVPVVVSDIPGNREVVDGGRCGTLFPVGDVSALSRALSDVLKGATPSLSQARERVGTRYNWDLIAQSTVEVYRSLM